MKKIWSKILLSIAILVVVSVIGMGSASAFWEDGIDDNAVQVEIEKPELSAEEIFTNEVITLINIEREKLGAAALERHEGLQTAAEIRAKEASVRFAHTRLDGSSVSTVFKENEIDFKAAGETLANGAKTSSGLVTAWMNSAAHKKVLLNEKFTNADLGIFQREDGRLFFAMLLISPDK